MPFLDRERRVVVLLAAALLAFHLVFARQYGWFRDELYYVACGERLAWGYVDHPPVVALFARIAQTVFGDSLVGLRAIAGLAASATIVLAGEVARVMGGKRWSRIVAPIAVAIAPYDLVVGHIYTMNAFEPLVWSGLALVVARALRDGDDEGLVWLGPIVGLGVLNKHSALWPAFALAFGLALSPMRRFFLGWRLWLGVASAAAVVSPHVVWQLANDFPTREFARGALSGKNEPYGFFGFIGQLVQLFHPLSAPLWIGGLIGLFVAQRLRPFRPLGVAALLVCALVFATQAKAYYVAPLLSWLVAAGAVLAEEAVSARPRARLALAIYVGVAVAGAIALLPAAVPVLPVPLFQRYAGALGILAEPRSGEKMRAAALPQLYADMHGWSELAHVVEGVVAELSPEERMSAVIHTQNYGQASAIEYFGGAPMPPVGSGDNAWWIWGPPRASPSVVVWVGHVAPGRLETHCGDVRRVATFDHPLARADERELPIHVCRHPNVTLAEAWPSLKHYR